MCVEHQTKLFIWDTRIFTSSDPPLLTISITFHRISENVLLPTIFLQLWVEGGWWEGVGRVHADREFGSRDC